MDSHLLFKTIRLVFSKEPTKRVFWLATVIVIANLLLSCSFNPHYQGVPPEEVQRNVEAPINQILRYDKSLQITEAYKTHNLIYLNYRSDDKTVTGFIDLDATNSLSIHTEWFPIFQLHLTDTTHFKGVASKSNNVPYLDRVVWDRFRNDLYDEFVPKDPWKGVILNYRDRENILYRDHKGTIHGKDPFQKTSDITLISSLRVEELKVGLFTLLEAFLLEQDIYFRQFLFETGETGPYARPFIYIDLDTQQLIFVSLEPYSFGSMPNNYLAQGGKAGTHFARSYYLDLLNRPITYFSRLSFFLIDTVWDASRGAYIKFFLFPDVDNTDIPPLNRGPGMDLNEWEKFLDQRFDNKGSYGNIEILVDGDQFFPYFVDSILDAKQSIKMRTYIFDRDDYAIKLADLLKRRSKDIDIKIMLDGLGTIMAQRKSAGTMPPDHEAPLGITTYLMKNSNLKVRNLTNPWFTGDHTKSTVIDSKVAYLGGMNIGREYRWEWHDIMMKIQGPVVNVIEHEFEKAWAHSSILGDFVFFWHVLTNSEEESLPDGYPIRVLKTSPVKSDIYQAQRAAIRRAKSYIYIENAYFSDVTIIYELVRAQLRGVDVRVIIPMEGNHGVMNYSNVIAANTLIKYGAKVYVYPGMSHVKAAIYDGWACLGSANFDKFSLRVNREMNLATSESSFAEELKEDVFKPDFERSLLLTKPLLAGWRNTFAFIVASQL